MVGYVIMAYKRFLSLRASIDSYSTALESKLKHRDTFIATRVETSKDNTHAWEEERTKIDDAIQSDRRYYNAIVRDYNYRLESFPDKYIAKKYHYTPREYFSKD